MNVNTTSFYHNSTEHVLWLWKGDYWNLQSGAEVGLYVEDRQVNGYTHYNALEYELPMTLSLYNTYDEQVQNVFTWVPDDDQWWITGFNPEFTDPHPEKWLW